MFTHINSQIDVLKRLNYRGANARNISDDQVCSDAVGIIGVGIDIVVCRSFRRCCGNRYSGIGLGAVLRG